MYSSECVGSSRRYRLYTRTAVSWGMPGCIKNFCSSIERWFACFVVHTIVPQGTKVMCIRIPSFRIWVPACVDFLMPYYHMLHLER